MKSSLSKSEWLKRVDVAVLREAPSVECTLRDAAVWDFARERGARGSLLRETFWRNESNLVGMYGPIAPEVGLFSRFVTFRTGWHDHADQLFELSAGGAENAARAICDFLRVAPPRMTNAREGMRDVAHYLREMRRLDEVVDENGVYLNGANSFELLEAYRRSFKNALASLQNVANQLLRTPSGSEYRTQFAKSPVLAAINQLRNHDVHNIAVSLALTTRIDIGKALSRRTFVSLGSSFLASLGPTISVG